MIKIIGSIITILLASQAVFADQDQPKQKKPYYVYGDGGMDFKCTDNNLKSVPLNTFEFRLFFNANSPRKGFDFISDENLASMNGDFVYGVEVKQQLGPNMKPQVQPLRGCKYAPMRMSVDNKHFKIYFECDGDGDAGYGRVQFDIEDLSGKGTIYFPEGQPNLEHPYVEDTKFNVTCQPNIG